MTIEEIRELKFSPAEEQRKINEELICLLSTKTDLESKKSAALKAEDKDTYNSLHFDIAKIDEKIKKLQNNLLPN